MYKLEKLYLDYIADPSFRIIHGVCLANLNLLSVYNDRRTHENLSCMFFAPHNLPPHTEISYYYGSLSGFSTVLLKYLGFKRDNVHCLDIEEAIRKEFSQLLHLTLCMLQYQLDDQTMLTTMSQAISKTTYFSVHDVYYVLGFANSELHAEISQAIVHFLEYNCASKLSNEEFLHSFNKKRLAYEFEEAVEDLAFTKFQNMKCLVM